MMKSFPFELTNNLSFRNLLDKRRLGGYACWKPYIILNNLLKLNENDILAYSDAGSTIPNSEYTIKTLEEYFSKLANSVKGILAFKSRHIEKLWTKSDIIDYFNALNKKNIYDSGQFSSGRIKIFRSCFFTFSYSSSGLMLFRLC